MDGRFPVDGKWKDGNIIMCRCSISKCECNTNSALVTGDRGDEVVSEAADHRGHPYLVLRKKGSESELSVYSVEQLYQILKLAGTKKVTETRICLEGIRCWIYFVAG